MAGLLKDHDFDVLKEIQIKDVKEENSQRFGSFKVYDLNYYQDEINLFEAFYTGEIQIGHIKITREFVKCKDRLADKNGEYDSFTYFTRMVDTRRAGSGNSSGGEIIATLGITHGAL